MRNWRTDYIRSFIAIIGLVLIFSGMASSHFWGEGFNVGSFFTIIGIILILIVAYWWYREYQKG